MKAKQARAMRQRKDDRMIHGPVDKQSIECDFVLGPYDAAVRAMGIKWGVDRLPDLVTPDLAQRFGKAMAALNEAVEANDPELVKAKVINAVKGINALDAAAEASGAPKASPHVIEFEIDGNKCALLTNDEAWPALKAQRPDLFFYTMTDIKGMIRAAGPTGELLEETRKHFPDAKIVPTNRGKPNYDLGGDFIPF